MAIRKHPEMNINKHQKPNFISTKLNNTIYLERKRETFENFVTPREENLPRKRYEVTTEKFEDSETNQIPLGSDSDLASAIDNVDESGQDEAEDYQEFDSQEDNSEAEKHWPLDNYGQPQKLDGGVGAQVDSHSPVDSYGRPYQHVDELGVKTGGRHPYHQSYKYDIIHTSNQNHQCKKPAGRVRMQV